MNARANIPADALLKFEQVYCSQCGREFGSGNEGYSHCDQHPPFVGRHSARRTEYSAGAEIKYWRERFEHAERFHGVGGLIDDAMTGDGE